MTPAGGPGARGERSVLKRIMRGVLRLIRWKIVGEIPPHRKMVIIGAPHTSNWDFPLAMVVAPALGLRIRWLGKHTLFRWPYAWFFRLLGGIPVDRTRAQGIIESSRQAFDEADDLILVIAPEGTRSRRDHWKSGFYRIAHAAGVPVVLVGIDGRNKTVVIGPHEVPGEDPRAYMDGLRAFYADFGGIKPDRVGPIRLRDEG